MKEISDPIPLTISATGLTSENSGVEESWTNEWQKIVTACLLLLVTELIPIMIRSFQKYALLRK
jgi:hypothetical protein